MPCYLRQSRNGSVVTHFIHFGNTATSSVKSKYITVPERTDQNEKPVITNEERAASKPRSAPKMYINEAQYGGMYFWACKYEFVLQLSFNLMIFQNYCQFCKNLGFFIYTSIFFSAR